MNIFPLVTKLLNAHGLETEIKNGWICLKGFQHKLTVSYEEGANNGNLLSVKLTFNIALSSFEIINESLVGLGPNLETAIENGVSYFAQNVLHVLLTGLWNYPEDEQSSLEKWYIEDKLWNATIGNMAFRAHHSNANDTEQLPNNIVETIQATFSKEILEKERYWIRIFYSEVEGNSPTVEVLLNNKHWEQACKQIEDLEWPKGEDFYSIRLFILLEKNGYTENPISELEAVDAIYNVIHKHDHIEADSLFDDLILKGYPQKDLFTATDFIPIALGRMFLSGLELDFSPYFEWFDEKGNKVETIELVANPYYAAATNLSWKLSLDDFQKIALSSSEVDAVNKALHDGTDPKDLIMSPTIFFTKDPTEEGMQKVQSYIQNLVSKKKQNIIENAQTIKNTVEDELITISNSESNLTVLPLESNTKKSKRWWEFWK